MAKKKPIICIPANVLPSEGLPVHVVRDTYIRAVLDIIGGVPLMIPAMGKHFNFSDIADRIDGLLLSGSPSHVSPAFYGKDQQFEDKYLDPARDATTLPMIKQAVDLDLPVMAICRGFQELNVVMGGTLHQKVHELPGKKDHRADLTRPLKDVYETKAHHVHAKKGGWFEKLKMPEEFTVNSLHEQGVDKLGDGLFVEAISDDGVIEAFSLPGKKFVVGVQWHPEGDYYMNDVSRQIIKGFGDALCA